MKNSGFKSVRSAPAAGYVDETGRWYRKLAGWGCMTGVLFLMAVNLSWSQTAGDHRDGKILEGEAWLPFSYPDKADFYVSPKGNDDWSGALPDPDLSGNDGPFLTLARAMEAVRELKGKVYFPKEEPVERRWVGSPHPLGKGRDIVVYIREGTYSLEDPLAFGPADGGERVETSLPTGAFEYHKLRDHYVTYAAYPGERAMITGGIPVTGWNSLGTIRTAPFNADTAAMFVAGGKRRILARTPNEGYFVPPVVSASPGEIHFRKGELRNWDEMEENRIVMLLRWHTGINRIADVSEKLGVARLVTPQEGVVVIPPRYYVENVRELLDNPGEWFFDRRQKEISYIPLDEKDDPVWVASYVPVCKNLISVKGTLGKPVRNLRFYGLTLEGTISGGSALSYEFAHACEFAGGEVRSGGGTGIKINQGCYQTRIFGNRMETIDNGAVLVAGPGNTGDGREIIRETLITQNRIYDCGGVNIQAYHTLMTTISHNYITRTRGRFGIDVGGWSNLEEAIDGGYLVEYNHLDNVQKDADDSGAIKTAGMTFGSTVRRNLIHHVHAGFFNDNVGFWFDNMSSGWVTEENIFYALEQGEMKLCAAMLEDNLYRNNFRVETPDSPPEIIIEGEPDFEASDMKMETFWNHDSAAVMAGSAIRVSAFVFNKGATGMAPVELYLDGKVIEKKLFPVIHNNRRQIVFETRIYEPGQHFLAIGSAPYISLVVEGSRPGVVYEDLRISVKRLPVGEVLTASATARNLTELPKEETTNLLLDNRTVSSQPVSLEGKGTTEVVFEITPPQGMHACRIGNSTEEMVSVFGTRDLDLSRLKVKQYCSARAQPCTIEADEKNNRFRISAGGSDFFHAEDSYAAAYLEGITGDFVATVTITRFGERTHEWFRAGLFVRNEINRSFDVEPGSKGSVLVFATPGRAGIEYDEFGNGCMHKASSLNLPENSGCPVYLKMIRHGNSFSGYISLDGKRWIIARHTTDIPGIGKSVDLGLAAGGPDKRSYSVEFSDLKIKTEKP